MKTPVTFTQKVADRICAELSKGRSLRSTCTDEGMPAPSTVLDWCEVHPEFGEQYARARLRGYSLLADEIIDISDEAEFEPVPGQDGEEPREVRVDATAVARNRLRVDSRKWMLSKMLPKVYGDRTVLAGDPEAPLGRPAADLSTEEIKAALKKLASET